MVVIRVTFDLSRWWCALFRNSGRRCPNVFSVFWTNFEHCDIVSAVFMYQNTDLRVNYF